MSCHQNVLKNLFSAKTFPQKAAGTAFPARIQRDYQEASSHGYYIEYRCFLAMLIQRRLFKKLFFTSGTCPLWVGPAHPHSTTCTMQLPQAATAKQDLCLMALHRWNNKLYSYKLWQKNNASSHAWLTEQSGALHVWIFQAFTCSSISIIQLLHLWLLLYLLLLHCFKTVLIYSLVS